MLFRFFVRLFSIVILLSAVRASAAPLLWNIPVESTKFIGRTDYLLKIERQIPKSLVMLSGLSGIGKTSLAYRYAHIHHSQYDIAWKFDAAKDLDDQIVQFAKELWNLNTSISKPNFSDPSECVLFVKNWLRQTKLRWILVFDDAKSYGDIIDYLPEIHENRNKSIIITSLSTRAQELAMRIEKFSQEESLEFLRFHLGDSVKQKESTLLAETLDHHPLALRQAISFIKFTPGSDIEDYIKLFQNKNEEFWTAERAALANDNFRANQPELYTCIKISLEKLKAENPTSHRLLSFLAQIHHTKIEGKLIQDWVTKFVEANPAAFGALLDRALVFKIEESKSSDEYAIHNYIRDVILHAATQEELVRAQETGMELFLNFLSGSPDIVFSYFESNSNHINHLKALCASKDSIDSDKWLELNIKLLYYTYYAQRKYDFSEALSGKISAAIDTKKFDNQLLVASFYNLNGYMRYLAAGLPEAIEESLKAYKILKTIDSEEANKELIMLLANNLGFFYYWQGDLHNCELCCQEAESIAKKVNDNKMSVLVYSYKFGVLCDKGEFEKAEALIPKLNKYYEGDTFLERVAGHIHKKLQAMLALKQNRNEEARAFAKSGYEHAVESSGGNEMAEIVGRPSIYLSIAESRLKNFHEAEKIARQAINIFDETYKSTHKNRRQANSHFALGLALAGQEKYEEALKEYLLAKEIYETLFIQLKIDDISDLFLKIVELGIKLKDELLIQEHMRQHIEIFGLDHPRSIKMSQLIDAV